MQIFLVVIFIAVFLILIMKMAFPRGSLSTPQLVCFFLLKVVAGIVAHFIYTYYYPQSDAYLFMEGGKNVFDQLLGRTASPGILGWNSSFDDSFFNNSRVMISINFLIHFLSFNNPFVHILFFCFFSFLGLTALFAAFEKHFPDRRTALIIGIYLIPSVLFWTSGIYKEGVAMLCIGMIIYHTDFGLAKSFSRNAILSLLTFTTLLFFIKVYIVACLMPLLMINFIVTRMGEKRYYLKYAVCFLIFVVAFHFLSKLDPRINFYQLIADKQAKAISEAQGGIFLEDAEHFIRLNYNDSTALISGGPDVFFLKEGTNYLSWPQNNMKDTSFVVQTSGDEEPPLYKLLYKIKPANSGLEMKKITPDLLGLSMKIPFALATVFYQPSLFKIQNALQLFSWVENSWLLLLIVLTMLFFNQKIELKKEVLIFSVLFALFQFAVIGLTCPVVGAIVRYKVTALPFLFTICLLYFDADNFMKRIGKSKA